jgi:hypothetical protein
LKNVFELRLKVLQQEIRFLELLRWPIFFTNVLFKMMSGGYAKKNKNKNKNKWLGNVAAKKKICEKISAKRKCLNVCE